MTFTIKNLNIQNQMAKMNINIREKKEKVRYSNSKAVIKSANSYQCLWNNNDAIPD